jgi:hypothetical protein
LAQLNKVPVADFEKIDEKYYKKLKEEDKKRW